MSPNILDRERDKFQEISGETYVKVTGILSTSGSGEFDVPMNCDAILRSVAGNVETYLFKDGGVSGTLLKTITVTYTSSNLKDLVSAVVT